MHPTPSLPAPLDPPPPALAADEWALLSAVVYADLFDSPLPLDHAVAGAMGLPIDLPTVRRLATGHALSKLVTLHPSGFLVLTGRERLVVGMPERETMTRDLLAEHRATLTMLASLPFVRGLVISGGVAHKNVTRKADIDLFVVAARGRVYTAYTMLFLATTLTRTRRIVCPNYLVDEGELAIAFHRDLFTAHQLVSARSLSGHPAYAALCQANEEWVRELFPSFAATPPTTPDVVTRTQGIAEALLWPTAPLLEAVVRAGWRFRLRRRAAKATHADVVLGDGVMKLHLSDYRARVLHKLAVRLDALREQRSRPEPSRRDLASANDA